ncbi:MAG: hypothetical protein EXQ95_13290 [Alphaproteobacteria bacterium]|nr:hypothetical protein [Alphaproteobacteria bacterium]
MTSLAPVSIGHGGQWTFGGDDLLTARTGASGFVGRGAMPLAAAPLVARRSHKPQPIEVRTFGGSDRGESGNRSVMGAFSFAAPAPQNLAESIRRRFESLGGVDLEIPAREFGRDPPRFDE